MFNTLKTTINILTGRHKVTMQEVTQKPLKDAQYHFENVNFEMLKLQAQTNSQSAPVVVENLEGGRAKVTWHKDSVVLKVIN